MFIFSVFLLSLWSAGVGVGHGCPELCDCFDKYGRHFAECSFKDLTDIPEGLPSNVTTLSLSANKISLVQSGSFDNVTQVTSLWMAHNEIVSIEPGTLAPLLQLRNLDISYNKMVDFPWQDLQNLTALQLLKMNHNEMAHLPGDAFSNLKDLRSLRLNNNRFTTVAEGTFDGLVFLAHLQIYNNPFTCHCKIDWLRDWILKTRISVPEQNAIVCDTPEQMKGVVIVRMPESKCMAPNVSITSEPNVVNTTLFEGTVFILNCEIRGNPKPEVIWKVDTTGLNIVYPLSTKEKMSNESSESSESSEVSKMSDSQINVFHNGTLVIPRLSEKNNGNYSCLATNEFGKDQNSLSVEIVPRPPPPPPVKKVLDTPVIINKVKIPSVLQPVTKTSLSNHVDPYNIPSFERKYNNLLPSLAPSANTEHTGKGSRYRSRASGKCTLTSETQYISNQAFNGSLNVVRQYTFDFGVIALGLSETDAKVTLNPLLLPKDNTDHHPSTSEGLPAISVEPQNQSEVSRRTLVDTGLYLCITSDPSHSAVQWSRIEDGVNTYLFQDLHPGTNYSLCLSFTGEDCEVQVLFTTRRRVPNLLIIIVVSVCLLTVSTVPLLGATCFHLVYKYRGKTYKLIMKAKDHQYHMERNLVVNCHLRNSYAESQRQITSSEAGDGEEQGSESGCGEGRREGDAEGSVVTESFTLSQYKGNTEGSEVGSEYSDKLPLGAEAVNISGHYKEARR
ncbi:immunoglobulin superfamily containing leucine-rich repeat protein 2 [Esox lucius]|uniref:Ig-like domain-containing protein n=1 Tax=Esox lucius TaxID=8010 RepID=A0AAY5K5S1_ESOLU|nr:immunoglobulin superfamily containing leucine-rich repeat protein 2 [Esox lucius]